MDNLRELAEKWETEAQKCDGITDGHVMRRLAKRVCAIELKAALADMEREHQRLDCAMRRSQPSGLRKLVERLRGSIPDDAEFFELTKEELAEWCASELEAAIANTGPSVPQSQSKTQYKRLVAQGAIGPSVPVSLLNKFRQQIDSNSYSRVLKKLGELITEAGGGSIGSSVLVSQLEEELQDAVIKVLSNNPEYRAPEMVGAVTALFETFITEARSHE